MKGYATRKLGEVIIEKLSLVREAEKTLIAANVSISLQAKDGAPDGPAVTVEIACDFDPKSSSYEEGELAVLAAARELLLRVSAETVDSLHAGWVEWSKRVTAG